MDGTITGTLGYVGGSGINTDSTGVFGFTPGANPTGAPFTATFTFDTALLDDGTGGPPTNLGDLNGPGDLSATATINGVTKTFLADAAIFVQVTQGSGDFTRNLSDSHGAASNLFVIDVSRNGPGAFLNSNSLTRSFSATGLFDTVTGEFCRSEGADHATGVLDLDGGAPTLAAAGGLPWAATSAMMPTASAPWASGCAPGGPQASAEPSADLTAPPFREIGGAHQRG